MELEEEGEETAVLETRERKWDGKRGEEKNLYTYIYNIITQN